MVPVRIVQVYLTNGVGVGSRWQAVRVHQFVGVRIAEAGGELGAFGGELPSVSCAGDMRQLIFVNGGGDDDDICDKSNSCQAKSCHFFLFV
jgi:hypothetical protein